jgi:hypothetical protein
MKSPRCPNQPEVDLAAGGRCLTVTLALTCFCGQFTSGYFEIEAEPDLEGGRTGDFDRD